MKLSAVFTVLLSLNFLLSCKKVSNNEALSSNVTIQNGVLTFKNTETYLSITANKNGEQNSLLPIIQTSNFKSLRSSASSNVNLSATVVNPTSNIITSPAFDSSLYTDYLLTILNADKIVNINGYYVKVDLENSFCSIIDATLYPDEYNDLKNNNFSNSHIMTFVNPNEPVIDVINSLRTNQLTWQSYLDQRASAKGGGGICFASGAKRAYATQEYPNIIPGVNLHVVTQYATGFIHFQLDSWTEAYSNQYPHTHFLDINFRVRYWYEYKGACKGSGIGDGWYQSGRVAAGDPVTATVYSGGSALSVRKLMSIGYIKAGQYSENLEDYISAYPAVSVGY